MANHCNNYAIVYGSKDSIKELLDKFSKVEDLWRDTFYEFLGMEPRECDVYDEFGSKWFVPLIENEGEDTDGAFFILSGESAWSPVVEFMVKLSDKYNLVIDGEYDEGGSDFGGFYKIENGKLVYDKTYNYVEYRYLSEGLEGLYHELEFDLENDVNDAIERLNRAKSVMSDEDYSEMYNLITKQHEINRD